MGEELNVSLQVINITKAKQRSFLALKEDEICKLIFFYQLLIHF